MPASEELAEPLLPKSAAPAKAKGKPFLATFGALFVFVAVRSFHPIIIDNSKDGGKLPYGKATPCVMNSLIDVIIGNLLSFAYDGWPGLQKCWNPESLKVFSAIAVVYAFGDFLEMQSMSMMGGAVYQILLQSKLVITACIMWGLRGQRQSLLQWNILLSIMIAMSAFCVAQDSKNASSEGSFPIVGFFVVMAKVFFSCLCAVLAEKYLKVFGSMPIYMQVAQLKFMWLWASLALVYTFDSAVVTNGFFSGWDSRTVLVAVSWVCKGWSTFTVLKILDSVLKNIGEAMAVLVIYLFEVGSTAMAETVVEGANEFNLGTFLMVLVVVLTVSSYTLAAGKK